MERKKHLDIVLVLLGLAMGIVFFLLPKTPETIVICLVVLFALLVHPIVYFMSWITKKHPRKCIIQVGFAESILAIAVIVFGIYIWPEARPTIEPPLEQWKFKDSPLFTERRKLRIAEEITTFRQYLSKIGLDTGEELPQIEAVASENPIGSYAATFGGPVYYDSLRLRANQLDDDIAITSAYSGYFFIKILMEPVFRQTSQRVCSSNHNQFASPVFALYFVWSFWEKRTEDVNIPALLALWEMRRRFGEEFTDRLAAFIANAFIDNTCGEKSADWEDYFYERVRIADQIIDSESSRWLAIAEILKKFGIGPKPSG